MVGKTLDEIKIVLDLSWVKYKDYQIVNTYDKLMYHLDFMKQADFLGFDTETNGTNICSLPFKSKKKSEMVGFSISYADNQGIYIPLKHVMFKNLDMSLVVEYIFPILETKPLCTHNGLFDYKVLYDIGCKLNIVHDSMLLLFNICSKVAKGSKALKNNIEKLYGITPIEFSDIFGSTDDYGKFKYVSEEVCRVYACADADYTRLIVKDNYEFLSKEQFRCYMRDCSYIPMIATSEYYGKPIDSKQLPYDLQACKDNIEKIKDYIYNYVGWKLSGDIEERYLFNIGSSDEVQDVLYRKLGYKPVDIKGSTGYTVDKFVMKNLKDRKTDKEDYFIETKLKYDIPNLLDSKKPLLSYKDDLRGRECPIASMILVIRDQEKKLTSFFNKIIRETDGEMATYYSGISMTNTETSRLVDFLQTLDGKLKYLVKWPDKSKYMFVADACQIELRVMAGLACLYRLCHRLDFPHTDMHVECAALILGVRPEDISAETRHMFKKIDFGIPYGMSVRGLVEGIFGKGLSKEEFEEKKVIVEEMLRKWAEQLGEFKVMLDNYRSIATTPREYNHKSMKGFVNTSYVEAPDGRRRIFDLGDMSNEILSKVGRMSGNFPIQDYARFIYLFAVKQFRDKMIEDGLMDILVEDADSPSGYTFKSKVTINGYIHDEIFGFVDNDIDPHYILNVIYDKCMIKIPGHPRYFFGVNIVNNWGEGKEGEFETTIDYIEKYKSNKIYTEPREDWVEVIADELVDFSNKEGIKYVETLAGDKLTKDGILDIEDILKRWEDYYYKGKFTDYGFKYRKNPYEVNKKGKPTDKDELINCVVGTLLKYKYKSIRVIYEDKSEIASVVVGQNRKPIKEVEPQELLYNDIDIDELDIDEDDLVASCDYKDCEIIIPVDIKKNINLLKSLLVK